MSAIIISINVYFVIDLALTKSAQNIALTIGVFSYSALYLLMCAYLILHLAISILDNNSVLRRNPVSNFLKVKNIMDNFLNLLYDNFQLIIKFIGPQIGDNFSQHQQNHFTPPR